MRELMLIKDNLSAMREESTKKSGDAFEEFENRIIEQTLDRAIGVVENQYTTERNQLLAFVIDILEKEAQLEVDLKLMNTAIKLTDMFLRFK